MGNNDPIQLEYFISWYRQYHNITTASIVNIQHNIADKENNIPTLHQSLPLNDLTPIFRR